MRHPMTTIGTLLSLLILLNPGNAEKSLKCWKCNGCEISTISKETCRTVDPKYQVAGCVTQVVRDHRTHMEMTIKKCDYNDLNRNYQCLQLPESQQISCNFCTDGDYCNNGNHLKTGSSYIVLLVLTLICSCIKMY